MTSQHFGYAAQLVMSVDHLAELDGLRARAEQTVLVMGQTFGRGQPVDLVKYAFVIAALCSRMAEGGPAARAEWLIADHFITEINKDLDRGSAETLLEQRVAYLQAINEVFSLNIDVRRTSEISTTAKYAQALDSASNLYESSGDFRSAVVATIPEDRRGTDPDPSYALAEMATIAAAGASVKVGPPYERLYDGPMRTHAKSLGMQGLTCVYGTRGYLFGAPELSPRVARDIDEFGVLPYKRDSKDLGAHRLDPWRDAPRDAAALIDGAVDLRATADLEALVAAAEARHGHIDGAGSETSAAGESLADRYERAIAAPLRRYCRLSANE